MDVISRIIQDSLKLAYYHKLLWVFALLAFAGGSNNFRSPNNSSRDFSKNDYKQEQINPDQFRRQERRIEYETSGINSVTLAQDDKETVSNVLQAQVLGTYNNAQTTFEDFQVKVESLYSKSIPYILVLILVFILAVAFGVFLILFLKSWAHGALLQGIKFASNNQEYSLRTLASLGRVSIRNLFKYKFYFSVLTTLGYIAFIIPSAVLIVMLFSAELRVVAVLFGLFLLVVFIAGALLLNLSNTFASRYIVYNGLEPKPAFRTSFNLVIKNIGKCLLLGILNTFVKFAIALATIVGVALVVLIVLGLASLNSLAESTLFVFIAVLFGVPAVVAAIAFFMVLGAYMLTYSNFTWSKLLFALDGGTNGS